MITNVTEEGVDVLLCGFIGKSIKIDVAFTNVRNHE